MSNPLIAPLKPICFNATPDSYFKVTDEKLGTLKGKRSLENVIGFYKDILGAEVVSSFIVDPEQTVDPMNRDPKNAMASLGHAQVENLHFIQRSAYAYRVTTAIWRTLTDDAPFPFMGRAAVRDAMTKLFYVIMGPYMFRGRLERYLKPNFCHTPNRPITAAEARVSKVSGGHILPCYGGVVQPPAPYTIYPGTFPDATPVESNIHADNGFPVGGTWSTPGAQDKVHSILEGIIEELTEAIGSEVEPLAIARIAEQFVYRYQKEKPSLVATKAKCKADYINESKVLSQQGRFYNVLPRQFVLLMQMATQPYEKNTRSIMEDPLLHSAQKLVLVRGGANYLVEALDEQLHKDDYAYVHVGDDSWVAYRRPDNQICMFALDCSAFDLTQHRTVMRAVHEAFRDDLAQIDPVAAGIWYAFMRQRLTVMEQTATILVKDGGPSGNPMQSKVNDVAMDVLIRRTIEKLTGNETEASLNKLLGRVGADMGFKIKLEQFHVFDKPTIAEGLELRPFQFVGFYFYRRSSGLVYPFIDLPRMMSQLPYPGGGKRENDNSKFAQKEAVRLASTALGTGIAPEGYAAQEALFQETSALLASAVANSVDGLDEVDLEWQMQSDVHALSLEDMSEFAHSLKGLYLAFAEGWGAIRLWAHPTDPEFDIAAPYFNPLALIDMQYPSPPTQIPPVRREMRNVPTPPPVEDTISLQQKKATKTANILLAAEKVQAKELKRQQKAAKHLALTEAAKNPAKEAAKALNIEKAATDWAAKVFRKETAAVKHLALIEAAQASKDPAKEAAKALNREKAAADLAAKIARKEATAARHLASQVPKDSAKEAAKALNREKAAAAVAAKIARTEAKAAQHLASQNTEASAEKRARKAANIQIAEAAIEAKAARTAEKALRHQASLDAARRKKYPFLAEPPQSTLNDDFSPATTPVTTYKVDHDAKEAVMDVVVGVKEPKRKTLGRPPRQSKETEEEKFERIHRQHLLDAEERRHREAMMALGAGYDDGETVISTTAKHASRQQQQKLAGMGGSRAAARSRQDVDEDEKVLGDDKDNRRSKNQRKKTGAPKANRRGKSGRQSN